MEKLRVGIFGLTGCAGDQLAILNCEEELLKLAGFVDICDWLMVSSSASEDGKLDVALVEGAVVSARDERLLTAVRARCDRLIALGTCAVWGGIARVDGSHNRAGWMQQVYGQAGARYDSGPARALSEIVKVDDCLTGCPVEKQQLLAAFADLICGNRPQQPAYPICAECKMGEYNCLLEQNIVCCGPLTVAGCGARCPSLGTACIGCRGPGDDANVTAAAMLFTKLGHSPREIARKLRTFASLASVSR